MRSIFGLRFHYFKYLQINSITFDRQEASLQPSKFIPNDRRLNLSHFSILNFFKIKSVENKGQIKKHWWES